MAAFIAWAILSVMGTLYFSWDRDARRKRRLWPVFIIASAAAFLVLCVRSGAGTAAILLLVPSLALIAAGNIYKVRFCGNCGATAGLATRGFRRPTECPRCGAPF